MGFPMARWAMANLGATVTEWLHVSDGALVSDGASAVAGASRVASAVAGGVGRTDESEPEKREYVH